MSDAVPLPAPPQPARLPVAFEQAYAQYAIRVYNYCFYRLGSHDSSDDAVQRVFEKVLANIDRYDPRRGQFADWLFAIARNVVRDQLRLRRRLQTVSLETVAEPEASGPSPEALALERERRRELAAAVSSLGAREREIVALKFAAGLSNRSIALLCGITPGNVAVILYRAVRRIRLKLERGRGAP